MGSIQLRRTAQSVMFITLLLLGCCGLLSAHMAFAQADQGAITGVVKDGTGAVIPGAQITLTNTDTNFVLQGKSGPQGEYVFSPIKIGNYTVSATATGFETTTQENVHVNIQDRLYIPVVLKLGAAKETVTVNSAPPMLQNDNGTVGQVMDTETINNTPLNGRNWVYIAQLTAGVAPGLAAGGARGGNTGDFSANGQRTTQNNFILDGVDNNVNVDDFQNGASYNVRPPPDALAEFKIDTSNYSAEFGHSAGAVVNASIKSGTNQIHGDVWEYVRNDIFDGADWDAGGAVPAYHENQFGATLGLPIWKNKFFYFGDAEANRIAFAQPDAGLTVPTPSMRNGDFSELFDANMNSAGNPVGIFAPNTGGQLPLTQGGGAVANPGGPCSYSTANGYVGNGCSVLAWNAGTPGQGFTGPATTNVLSPGDPSVGGMMDVVAQEVLNHYPLPNAGGWNKGNLATPDSGQSHNNYNVNLPIHDDTFQWDQRLDWNLSAKNQSYARYSYTHEQTSYAPPLGPILDGGGFGTDGTVFNLAQNFMASDTHIFSPTVVNEFRFGYNWGLYEYSQLNSGTPADSLIPGMGGVPFTGFAGPNGGLPSLHITGLTAAGASHDTPSTERQNVYQILDNVTKIHHNQSFKFGVQLESIRTAFAQSTYPRNGYNFNGVYTGKDYGSGANYGGISNTGTGAADMLTDNMGNIKMSPGWDTEYYRNYRAAYIQDDWKLNSRMTVNLGVRYDFIQPDSSKAGNLANFVIGSQSLTAEGQGVGGGDAIGTGHYVLPAQVANSAVLAPSFLSTIGGNNINIEYTNANPHSLVSVQHYNFGPRIGFAYQIDPKTVVRSGYGMFFGAIEAPGGAELETNYPFSYTVVLDNQYLTQYGACDPNTQAGAFNINSGCPSNSTTDANYTTAPSPGASVPTGLTPLAYATTIESGASGFLNNGGIAAYGNSSGVAMSDSNIKTPYTQSYNLTVEREVSKDMVASVSYVGNNAKHTFAGTNPLGPLAVTNPAELSTQAFPALALSASAEQWIGESMYNGLQAKLEKRYSDGLSFLATYTWSHAMDDAGNPGIGGGPPYRNTNIIPLKQEFTSSNYDTRQRVTVNGFYDLPFGTGRKYLQQGGVLDYLVGGWSTSLTWTAQTGIPFTVITGGGNFQGADGFNQLNAIRVGNPFKGGGSIPAANLDTSACPATVRNRTNWYNPCAFIDPKPGSNIPLGTLLTDLSDAIAYSGSKSNQIHGPGWERINMSGFKNFKTVHGQYVRIQADAFNLFNTPSWGQPSGDGGANDLSSTGGLITGVQSFQLHTPDARFFQLAAKYVF